MAAGSPSWHANASSPAKLSATADEPSTPRTPTLVRTPTLARTPSGARPDPLDWDVPQVRAFVAGLGFEDAAEKFAKHGINGRALLRMTLTLMLNKLKLSLNDALNIESGIAELKGEH